MKVIEGEREGERSIEEEGREGGRERERERERWRDGKDREPDTYDRGWKTHSDRLQSMIITQPTIVASGLRIWFLERSWRDSVGRVGLPYLHISSKHSCLV